MLRVKICGITRLEDALACAEAGADALGFIFVEGTPRYVTPAQAAAIIQRLPPFLTPVGVFWDHPVGHVKAVAEACGLRALQFHGDETAEDLAQYPLPVIKTVKLPPASAAPGQDTLRLFRLALPRPAAAVLVDSAARWSEGEAREPVDWKAAAAIAAACRAEGRAVILSGGLTPDNVARAVAAVKPYAVDVNSGVESEPGRKDPRRVRRFIAEARRAL
ncbi:MAG TPA: phosphoribosylanthranilate isomerase [Calidithermus sp.]|nr:phosphoribosylanthranilate isomerase [Calidithermus sp.]